MLKLVRFPLGGEDFPITIVGDIWCQTEMIKRKTENVAE